MMYMRALVLYLLTWITVAYQQPLINFTDMKPSSSKPFILGVSGSVYPLGFYTATIKIGRSAKPYTLDIDSGSDLTWVTCDTSNNPPSNSNPHYNVINSGGDVIKCTDPECSSVLGKQSDLNNKCVSPRSKTQTCEYKTTYADGSSAQGSVVRDTVSFKMSNGELLTPRLLFGCTYQTNLGQTHQPIQTGVLGLGRGAAGFMKQLSGMKYFRNVFGHCFGSQNGFIFIGDDALPTSKFTWTPLLPAEHYLLGKADILISGERPSDIKGLDIIIDSGSTYTYFKSMAYGALLDLITKNLRGLPLKIKPNDGTLALPVCWEDAKGKPFRNIREVASYFKPLALSFPGAKLFQVPPQNYLIISAPAGQVCLGIMNSTTYALGDKNVIGDIFMQNNLVVYDNENGKVGWAVVSSCLPGASK